MKIPYPDSHNQQVTDTFNWKWFWKPSGMVISVLIIGYRRCKIIYRILDTRWYIVI